MQFVFAIFYYMETLIFLLTGILFVSLCRVLYHLSADFFHLETGSSVLFGMMFLAFLAALMIPQLKRKRQENLPELNQICCFLPTLFCFILFELTFDLPALAVQRNGLILLVQILEFFFAGFFFKSLYRPGADQAFQLQTGVFPVCMISGAVFSLLIHLWPQFLYEGLPYLVVLLFVCGFFVYRKSYTACKKWTYPLLAVLAAQIFFMLWQNRGTVPTENTGKYLLADQQLEFESDENNRVFNVTRDHVPVMELELQPMLYLQRFPEIAAMLVQQQESDHSVMLIAPEYSGSMVPLSLMKNVQSIQMAVPVPILAGMLHEQVFQNIPVDFSKMIFYHSALSAYRADNAFERKNLILVDMPYPDNFARNYYFTREFFQTCKNNLLPQGVVAVILPDIGLLDQQERQTAENIIRKTLQSVFANVIRIEGKHSVLFASDSENLSDDPSALDDRAAFLELYPSELLPANLLAVTLPVLAREKQEQLKEASVMETDWENVPLNTVNSPVLCYQVLRSEMLHGKKVPPWLDRILEKLLQYHYSWDKIWYWAGGIFMLLFLYAFLRYFVPQKAVHKNIFRSFENGFFAVGILLFSLTSLRSYDSGYGMGALAFHTFILCLMLFLFTLQPRDEGNWFSPFLCGILWIMIARNGINAAFPNLLLAAGACGICAFQHKISQQTIEAYDNFRLFRGSVLGITTAFFIFPLFMLLPYGLWIWAGFLLLIRIVHARMETDGMTIKPA